MNSSITPRLPGIRFVHSPGPTRVPDEVMHAMQRPMTDMADGGYEVLVLTADVAHFNAAHRWRAVGWQGRSKF